MGRSCGPLEGKRRRPYPSHGLPRLPIPYSGEAPESACSYDPANSLIRRRFKDSVNPQCTGKALMRDALMVNQKKISNLQTGDKVNVTGVLATRDSEMANSSNTECYFAFSKSKIESAANTTAAAGSAAAPAKAATTTKSTKSTKSTKTSSTK